MTVEISTLPYIHINVCKLYQNHNTKININGVEKVARIKK